MNEELRHYDYERLIQEARMQRSIALGNAIAGLAHLIWRGGEHAVGAVARVMHSGRPGHRPL